jgi:membrane protein DedA with SNARE-associated domain
VNLPDLLVASSGKPLPGVFHTFEPLLHDYGYFAVSGLLVAENTGIPFPGETVLIAAALYAGTGRLNIWLVLLVAIVSSVAGACIGYLIGARGGRPLAERFGRYILLSPERLDKLEDFFQRRGGLVIVFGRFVEGARQLMGILVGISEMSFRRFLVFTTIGAAMWCAVWGGLGYLAGDHVETIARYSTYFFVALAVLVVAIIAWRVHQHRRER